MIASRSAPMPGSLWSCMILRYGRADAFGMPKLHQLPAALPSTWTCCEPTAPITLDVKPAAVQAALMAVLMAPAMLSLVAPTPELMV